MATQTTDNRRQEQRYGLVPGYCSVAVRRLDCGEVMHGHAYDISVTGIRVELDERLTPGEQVQLWIDFGDTRITTRSRVVWQFDAADDPGPLRLALDFGEAISPADRNRLLAYIANVGILRAA